MCVAWCVAEASPATRENLSVTATKKSAITRAMTSKPPPRKRTGGPANPRNASVSKGTKRRRKSGGGSRLRAWLERHGLWVAFVRTIMACFILAGLAMVFFAAQLPDIRALDTITAFCASDEGGKLTVDKFFVAGGSKRGWTTWTTAAVDNRVVAIAPLVIDMLNIRPSFQHHWEVYGFYAPAVADYTRAKIMDWDGTPEYAALMKIEEPYEYRERLTLPKFIINASGDQFFVPDSAQFYWRDLKGTKYLRYVPNADHSLKDSDAWMTLLASYSAIVKGSKLPKFDWSMEKDGSIRVKCSDEPKAVKLWQATNPNARDFRVDAIGKAWTSTDLTGKGSVYVGKVEKPERGWTAFFVEMTYDSGSAAPYKYTTQVRVIPETKPFKYVQPKAPR